MMRFAIGAVVAVAASLACKGGVEPASQAGGGETRATVAGTVQGPAVACDQPTWDFGTVAQGKVVRHVFALRNIGDAPLKIESARASCGCTASVVSSNEVPPGGDAQIEVSVNTQGRRGPLEQSVVVTSNDPKQPRLTLKVVGRVEVVAGFTPSTLNLGRLLKGSRRTEVVKVESKDPGVVRLTGVKTNDSRVEARIVEDQAGGPAVEVVVAAGDQEGPLTAMVTATTNLDDPKEIVLRMSGLVTGDIGAEPPRVFFRDFAKDKPQNLDLRITALTGKPFRILAVEDSQRAVHGEARREGAGWVVALTLLRKPEAEEGAIRIRTDRKDQPVLEVPYRVGGGYGRFRAGVVPLRRALKSVPTSLPTSSP